MKTFSKGGIEGEVGWFRRNRLVPVPGVGSGEELEQLCLAGAASELRRRLSGRPRTVGEDWAEERSRLRALPSEPLETRAGQDDAEQLGIIRGLRGRRGACPAGGSGRAWCRTVQCEPEPAP